MEMVNKILQENTTITSLEDFPTVVQEHIRTKLEEYFEPEEEIEDEDGNSTQQGTVVQQDDGSLEVIEIDYKLRNALPEEFTDEVLKELPRYSFTGDTTVTVESGTPLTITDEASLMEEYVHTLGDQEIPLHFQIYYRISVSEQTEEIILVDAMYHTFSYAEYLTYR